MQRQEIAGMTKKVDGTASQKDIKGLRLKDSVSLSGGQILNQILSADRPEELVNELSDEDFYWLIKKIGEKESVDLLELASVEKWQFILDLEIWINDRLDISHFSRWLSLLEQADCRKLVRWMFDKGEFLAYYQFFRSIQVIVLEDKDEALDLPDGFFTLDGVFHIKVIGSEHRENIENILHVMADEDLSKYQALLIGLAGVVPAEVEEELYRIRNVRLAEHGFLPFEEAMEVYSPLDPGILRTESLKSLPDIISVQGEDHSLAPIIPLAQADTQNLFIEVASGIKDSVLLDRLRLEFAGLANQIISAERLVVHDIEVLKEACKKTARIVNLALEKVSGSNTGSAVEILRRYSLQTLFRVGVGVVLKLKWEAERCLKQSWFYGQGLEFSFWGEPRGRLLSGLLAKIPRYYIGSGEGEEYKDFEWLSELNECLEVVRGMMVLDGLLEKIVESYNLREEIIRSPEITFHPLLFNLWARLLLNLAPSFSGVSLEQAQSFFLKLRGRSKNAPFSMEGFRKIFIRDFIRFAADADHDAVSILENTLSRVWNEFCEEYEYLPVDDLDSRYSKFLTIETDV